MAHQSPQRLWLEVVFRNLGTIHNVGRFYPAMPEMEIIVLSVIAAATSEGKAWKAYGPAWCEKVMPKGVTESTIKKLVNA
eukprot:16435303-Heterocapsa_arctica.AAC.1